MPLRRASSQCVPEMFWNFKQMSHDSRRPIVITSETSGMASPPPTGTSSPKKPSAMMVPRSS
jgi:hypothetical protein